MEKPRRRSPDPEMRRRTLEWIQAQGGGYNEDIVADIIENGLKMLQDVRSRGDARVIQSAIRELRYQFRLFDRYKSRRVCVFGSAQAKDDSPEYLQAREFAKKAVDAGFMVITGAGPGIMQAGNEGAGPEHSFGCNIRLPWEQVANPVIEDDKKLITFRYFFTRKFTFVRQSDAIALFPGGFGTLDELFEALTLVQTGKSHPKPLVLLDRPGGTYWSTWEHQVRAHLLRNDLISEDDLSLFYRTESVDDAVRCITRFYRNYHSMRFVRDLLVIRLNHAPSDFSVNALNEDFADLISGAPFSIATATPEEHEDEDRVELARISFGFNRRNYGRLRQLIDRLNGL